MEAICSSEMSVDFQLTIRRHISEDSTLHFKTPLAGERPKANALPAYGNTQTCIYTRSVSETHDPSL
jgi:hypothetical protein